MTGSVLTEELVKMSLRWLRVKCVCRRRIEVLELE